MNSYQRGFMNKCAEYGVDPYELSEYMSSRLEKEAGIGGSILGLLKKIPGRGVLGRLWGGSKAQKTLLGAGNAINKAWGGSKAQRAWRGTGRALKDVNARTMDAIRKHPKSSVGGAFGLGSVGASMGMLGSGDAPSDPEVLAALSEE